MLTIEEVLRLKAGVGVRYISKPTSPHPWMSDSLYLGASFDDAGEATARFVGAGGSSIRVKCCNYGKTWAIDRVNLPSDSFDTERKYLLDFASKAISLRADVRLGAKQLRALWTAYCFHKDLCVDTASYDTALRKIWEAIERPSDTESLPEYFKDYDEFESFMAAQLV